MYERKGTNKSLSFLFIPCSLLHLFESPLWTTVTSSSLSLAYSFPFFLPLYSPDINRQLKYWFSFQVTFLKALPSAWASALFVIRYVIEKKVLKCFQIRQDIRSSHFDFSFIKKKSEKFYIINLSSLFPYRKKLKVSVMTNALYALISSHNNSLHRLSIELMIYDFPPQLTWGWTPIRNTEKPQDLLHRNAEAAANSSPIGKS